MEAQRQQASSATTTTSEQGERAPATVRTQRWRGDIEGLRGIAILAVVLYHADPGILPGGFVGVDAFFVISGFLITRLLMTEFDSTGTISIANFYARRIRRLMPALLVVIAATVAASDLLFSPLQATRDAKDAFAALFDVMNYRLALQGTNYLDASLATSPFQHFWSLAVEEQMYLVWPVLLLGSSLLWRRSRRSHRGPVLLLTLGTAASFYANLRLTHSNEPWAFYSFPTRAWELGVGALVSFAAPALRTLPRWLAGLLGPCGIAMLCVAALHYSTTTAWPGLAAALPVGGAVAIVAAGCSRRVPLTTYLLDNPPLRFVGRISYSWYLWHWPALILAPAVLHHPLDTTASLAIVGASALVATGSYFVVERPIHRSRWWAQRARRGFALALGLTSLGTGACIASVAALALPVSLTPARSAVATTHTQAPEPLTGVAADLARQTVAMQHLVADPPDVVPDNVTPSLAGAFDDEPILYQDGCVDTYTSIALDPCSFGDPTGSESVVLFGDSHAAMWFPAIEQAAVANSWRLYAWSKDTCPPIELDIFSPDLDRDYTECTTWRDEVLQEIQQLHPALVVLGMARHYTPNYGFSMYDSSWMNGLAEMVEEIRSMGSRVLVMGPIPKPSFDVPSCLSANLETALTCATLRGSGVDLPGMRSEESVVTTAGGSYVNTLYWLCNTEAVCPPIIDDTLVYRDDNHLTATFAASLSAPVQSVLELAITGKPAPGSAIYLSPSSASALPVTPPFPFPTGPTGALPEELTTGPSQTTGASSFGSGATQATSGPTGASST